VSTDLPFDAFLSHCSDDKPAVETLAHRLRESGITPWLDKWHLVPGDPWQPAIEQALSDCPACVVFFGPSGTGPWQNEEMRTAISQSVSDRSGYRVVPVLLPGSTKPERNVPAFLKGTTWVVFEGSLDDADAFHRLVSGIRGVAPGPDGPTAETAEPDEAVQTPAFPPVWTVAHHRNRDFTGREEILESLRAELCSGSPAAVTQAIAGLGGVGKTQLAIEYAYRHAGEYDAVLWVGADGAEQAAANLSRQALELKLPGVTIETPQDDALRAVQAWLEHTPGWLLIFDNANHPDDVRGLLPRSLGLQAAGGHVLITSRHRDWTGTARSVGVPVWSREESQQFVQERTGQDAGASADALCEALGDLPLAVAQACGYITARETAITEYLELFQTRRAELWERESPPDAYHGTVATTWSLALEQLPATAVALLRVCSWLAPEPIPDWLFRTKVSESVPVDLQTLLSDPMEYQDARAELLRYSMLNIDDDRLQVHRLLQTVVRESLNTEAREDWQNATLNLVNIGFQPVEESISTWRPSNELLPHAVFLSSHDDGHFRSATRGRLLNQASLYLSWMGQFEKASELMQQSINVEEDAEPPDLPVLAIRYLNHAVINQDLGTFSEARSLAKHGIAIVEELDAPDIHIVATAYSNLATIELELGNYVSAHDLILKAIDIAESAKEPIIPTLVPCYNNLALIRQDLGDFEGAKDAIDEAIRLHRMTASDNPTKLAHYQVNLAGIYRDLDDLDAAKKLVLNCMRVNEDELGRDHPATARAWLNLAVIELNLGNVGDA
jgi:tetratricopeptide (TPR) repeat protein